MLKPLCLGILATALFAAPASADELPASIGTLLREANPSERPTIVNVIKRLYPDRLEEVDELVDEIEDEEKAQIGNLGLTEGWTGEAQLGATALTGNSDEWTVSGSAKLKRKGPHWEHRLEGSLDLNTNEGERTDERLSGSYHAIYDFSNSPWFVTGGAIYDRDTFKGITRRFTEEVALGYDIVDEDEMSWEVHAGPALRQSLFTTDERENELAAFVSTEFEWEVSQTLTFAQDARFVIDKNANSLEATTSITKDLFGQVRMRLSVTLDWESDPVEGNEQLDMRSRGSVVVAF
ncbi:DUF481 domain-containing protein [Altererythrobacter salegens]|uniref:DUF481 domain-containing protein n=1 Tax=Croceibacterium salegens TaxID=1737568 RepID=A0A6I4SZ22_9SPHN|nr:DUF481 domain-containing protein [Croceibacterium salegens]MXO60688.1 DUF481 domain-containing protein [Croceibacterium salegens]